jgi:hypothetical protein
MPKATKAGRQIARFDDGELWCADDAAPPVSPGGWYFRPGGAPVVWIGPFPTAEAAKVAPCGGDPLATARRRLDAWARAKARPGSEPPAEAGATADGPAGVRRTRADTAAARPAASGLRRQAGTDRDAGPDVEQDGTRPRRISRADRGAPGKDARLAPAGVATAGRTAGGTGDGPPAPSAPCAPARAADPLRQQPGLVGAGGPRQASEGIRPPPAAPSAPRQLAFGFGQDASATDEHGSESQLAAGRKQPSRPRQRPPAVQGTLPF